jgi:hypothetical protein
VIIRDWQLSLSTKKLICLCFDRDQSLKNNYEFWLIFWENMIKNDKIKEELNMFKNSTEQIE